MAVDAAAWPPHLVRARWRSRFRLSSCGQNWQAVFFFKLNLFCYFACLSICCWRRLYAFVCVHDRRTLLRWPALLSARVGRCWLLVTGTALRGFGTLTTAHAWTHWRWVHRTLSKCMHTQLQKCRFCLLASHSPIFMYGCIFLFVPSQ